VLSDDYFTVPASALRSLHSVLTVVGGAVVHSGPIEYWAYFWGIRAGPPAQLATVTAARTYTQAGRASSLE
jgi:hypothetical protein